MRRLSLLVALAAASCQPCPTPPPAAPAAAAPSLAAPAAVLPSLRSFVSATSTASGRRNLFAYGQSAMQKPVRRTLPPTPEAAVPAVQAVAATTTVEAPREAPFAYHYLGNFGPDRGRIAVFKRDGDVVNARVGETLGEHKLQRIGVESADLSAPGRAGVVTAAIVPKP